MSPKNLNASNKTHKNLINNLRDKRILQVYKKFENIIGLNQDFVVVNCICVCVCIFMLVYLKF